ncbi:MAG: DUF433 domain-containing protein [Clostridiales Family XIII bacterium]|nr:DUF433 domain-containing protein [Clostridiales Family XIII bacterium]
MERFTRIQRDIGIMGGKACIKGTRVTVGMIVAQIGGGKSVNELLSEYPYLKKADILQALRYAAWSVEAKEAEIAFA